MTTNINLPAEIDRGLRLLQEGIKAVAICETIDDAKYWENKADAMRAWAKIHKSLEIDVEAKRLKLIAYRRMGELAAEERPPASRHRVLRGRGRGNRGCAPGPAALLMEHGLSKTQAATARRLAIISPHQFDALVNCPRPPSPTLAFHKTSSRSEAWMKISGLTGPSLKHFRGFCRANGAAMLARQLSVDEATEVLTIVCEVQEWLDEFERHLPKSK